jgi:hypothetical protein
MSLVRFLTIDRILARGLDFRASHEAAGGIGAVDRADVWVLLELFVAACYFLNEPEF